VKPEGSRRLQPVVNEFFYWLRASQLETTASPIGGPIECYQSPAAARKDGAFWHGHFAVNESKVRDYRKLLDQLELFEAQGTGNFRDLMVAVAQDPAMLTFLDAGVNVKGAANEISRAKSWRCSHGRRPLHGNGYSRSRARLHRMELRRSQFVVNKEQHDDGEKTFLGKTAASTASRRSTSSCSSPPRRLHLGQNLSLLRARGSFARASEAIGSVLRDHDYQIAPLLETIFLSRDFYSPASVGTHIKSPVDLAVSTYRKLGLANVPGVPDFNVATGALGQRLFGPPTVAVGPAATVGSLPACCWSAPILGATFCFQTSISFRRIASPEIPKCGVWRSHPAGHGHQLGNEAGWQERRSGRIEHGGRPR